MKSMIAGATLFIVLVGLMLMTLQCDNGTTAVAGELTKFTSYNELKAFLKEKPGDNYHYNMREELDGSLSGAAEKNSDSASSGQDYSTTNIQVEGVDEADIIKTDGEFLYIVSKTRVIIVKAYPTEESQILAEIKLDENIDGIYINGDRLVIIHQNWNDWEVYYEEDRKQQYRPGPGEMPVSQTYLKVYDIADKANPVLARDVSLDGNYFGSRMVGDYVYAIINTSAYEQDGEVKLPVIHLGSTNVKIDATDIYYIDIDDYYYNFTTIAAINVKEDDQEPTSETMLLGSTSNLYVSLNNIYVTSTVWSNNSEKTAIHRIHTSDGEIVYEASGEAPGIVLNQFSMDEHQGFFRLATTTTGWGGTETGVLAPDASNSASSREETAPENTSANHLYILDMDLNIVGSVENMAPGEQIYSARFMGDRGYMVTFKKVDPLFVIDLADPYDPKILGELKITGYSDYLHPYGENHLLGIGKESIADDEGDFAWYQGVKISLFDVTDVANPIEITKYEIGDRGTDSPVLRDHKALLFDEAKNLLVLPVWLAEIDKTQYPYGEIPPYAYGEIVWQGAYVFDISIDDGIQLKGKVTHQDVQSQKGDYYYGADTVQRSLYIDNILYTISEAKIKMNGLEDLNEINMLPLSKNRQ